MNYLIVVTFGRSGSTLLMSVLNSFDGVCIRGENNNVLLPAMRMSRRLKSAKEKHVEGARHTVHAWYGMHNVDYEGFLEDLRISFVKRVLRPHAQDKLIGFKEIRFGVEDGVPKLSEYLTFLRKLFPGCRFIFNSRSAKDAAKSGWWAKRDDAEDYINNFQSRMLRSYSEFKESSVWVEYEGLLADPESVAQEIGKFIDIPVNCGEIQRVLSIRHSLRPTDRGFPGS